MKFNKIFTVLAAAASVLGIASCSDVTDPVLQTPDAANFKIFTPPFQNEYYNLTPQGTFDIDLNEQPGYGVSVVTQYRLDVCLDDKFEAGKFATLTPTGSGTLLKMTLKEVDLASALTAFQSKDGNPLEEEDYVDMGEQKVYLRGRAFVSGAVGSEVVTSNIVTLNRVQSFYSVPKPAPLYIVGNYCIGATVLDKAWTDWIAPMPANEMYLMEYALMEADNAVGSKIFSGDVDFQNNSPIFRFYTELGSWDENSWGVKHDEAEPTSDNPQSFDDFTGAEGEEPFKHELQKTKDSFKFPNCPGGVLHIVVDMSGSKPTMTVTPAENK